MPRITPLHPLYVRWQHMRYRCYNPNNSSYHKYGARGIRVCERWHKFANFLADMEATFRPGLTIDRINSEGDYSPENCRWATITEQNQNRRNNVYVDTPYGPMLQRHAAAMIGVAPTTLVRRERSGKPILAPKPLVDTPWGLLSLPEAATKAGVKYGTLRWRLIHNKPLFAPLEGYPRYASETKKTP